MLATALTVTLLPGTAYAAGWETTDFPITQAIFNTCNNEIVIMNGILTISTRITPTPDGRFRFQERDRTSGAGDSDTGAHYIFRSIETTDIRSLAEPFIRNKSTSSLYLKKVSGPPRSGESLEVEVTNYTLTNTETGETTLIKQEFEPSCE